MFVKLGTSGRTRTATPVKAMDFESIVSTNFTTLALCLCFQSDSCDALYALNRGAQRMLFSLFCTSNVLCNSLAFSPRFFDELE